MRSPSEITLTESAWAEISRHAVDAFPEECCGVILDYSGREVIQRFKNIQNQLHALDPETYPREATIAYAMDPKELEATIDEATVAGARIKAFYHSHPGHEAYFSEEDKAFAMPFGEPTFPETAQIVISIYDRAVKRICAYAWADGKNDFGEIPLRKTSQ
jgi:proteasome lid subunit RPN8/RPN11